MPKGDRLYTREEGKRLLAKEMATDKESGGALTRHDMRQAIRVSEGVPRNINAGKPQGVK